MVENPSHFLTNEITGYNAIQLTFLINHAILSPVLISFTGIIAQYTRLFTPCSKYTLYVGLHMLLSVCTRTYKHGYVHVCHLHCA